VLTTAAAAARDFSRDTIRVFARSELVAMGCGYSEQKAHVAADRWRVIGNAVVLHNGELTREQRWRVGVINCGPRSLLASFSAAEYLGLSGWNRDEIHVLAPAGVPRPELPGLPVVLHRARVIDSAASFGTHRCQRIANALALAASSFTAARPACGILAAGVQQRLTTAAALREVVAASPNCRHRHALLAAIDDIAGGAQALSEIDFVGLCRRHGLPPPVQQTVRRDSRGRRRYLDAEWRRADGRRVVAEVDGAVHLAPRRWFDDQLRQNEVVLDGSLVLRFPTVVVRTEERLVADQLRRALF
jgi:hypothetical protein